MPNSDGQQADRRVFDKTTVTLLVAGLAAIGLTGLIVSTTPKKVSPLLTAQSGSQTGATSSTAASPNRAAVQWATSAPGRVEPKGGDVNVRAEASGRVVNVFASAGDKVRTGDLLLQLRDDEPAARIAQAKAEVAVRVRERDEEPEKDKKLVEIREAADAHGQAERALHAAWLEFDRVFLDHRAGRASNEDLAAARTAIDTARENVSAKSDALTILEAKEGAPLPTRLDSGLTLSRADLRLAEIAFQNTRVRAPIDGTVLRFNGQVGEMVSPTGRQPVALMGDMSAVQITAEVAERDVSKVRVGQTVIVRSNAFGDTEFRGRVTEVAPSVGSPGLRSQGPRQQLDAEVLEVTIELDGNPSVLPGMRVDVFFKAGQEVSTFVRK